MSPRESPAGWLVYRCPGSETGPLEELLGELGHKVWTPRVWFRKRVPRKHVYRVVLLSMLPSYLFVKEDADLKVLASLGARHGFWGPMVIRGERVRILDVDLEGLRAADDRTSAPRKWIEPLAEPVHTSPIIVRPLTDKLGGGAMIKEGPLARRLREVKEQRISGSVSGSVSGSEGAHRDTKSGVEMEIPLDALRTGDRVRVASGPLASLQLVAYLERVEGDVAHITAFGGRVQVPLKDLERC